jgi:C4-dicarboxylate-specific signal transduction histidine kinase
MPRSGARSRAGAAGLLRHLRVLRTVTAAVSRSLNLNEVLQKSVDALTDVTGHEIASLHLVSVDERTLLLRGERGLSDRLREVNEVLPVGQGLIGRVAVTGRCRRVDQVTKASDLLPLAREVVIADGIQGFVCVPIRARRRILGTVSLGRRSPRPFTDEEVALLECTADQIGLALDNARLYSETRQQLEHLRRSHTEAMKAERLAAVEELARGVAHEINNPLMIILGQVHLLLQSRDSDEILRGLTTIDAATKRAADIIRHLMLFAERVPLRLTRCRIGDQVRQVLNLKREQLEIRHVQVRADIDDAPEIWADAAQIQEALANLIENAEQAMTGTRSGGTLAVRVARQAAGIRIEVADDGPGIPPDDLPRVFNPFFTTKPPGEGRGLGLSVAYSIVSAHDGRLWAENRREGGAVFVLELPVGAPRGEPALSP